MNGETFGAGAVIQLTGLAPRTFENWCSYGLVTFEQEGQGTGHWRRFGFADLVRVFAIIRLRDSGVSMQGLKRAITILKAEYSEADPLGSGTPVGDRGSALLPAGERRARRRAGAAKRHGKRDLG